MSPNWQRISARLYRLDDVWTVGRRWGGKWRAYRRAAPMLATFDYIADAMAEAERLRKEDEGYR